VRLKEKNWSERVLSEECNWKTKEVGLKSGELVDATLKIVKELEDIIFKSLSEKYGPQDETNEEAPQADAGDGHNRES